MLTAYTVRPTDNSLLRTRPIDASAAVPAAPASANGGNRLTAILHRELAARAGNGETPVNINNVRYIID